MQIKIESAHLGEIIIVAPEVFEDARGFFMETYRADQFKVLGLPTDFVQDNSPPARRRECCQGPALSIRTPHGQAHARHLRARAFLVAVDLRKGSPTLGEWWGTELSSENKKWTWAPASFARGFCVLSDWAEVQYKTTGTYNGQTDTAIRFDDRDIGIRWPISDPQISERDKKAIPFAEWLQSPASDRFQYKGIEADAR